MLEETQQPDVAGTSVENAVNQPDLKEAGANDGQEMPPAEPAQDLPVQPEGEVEEAADKAEEVPVVGNLISSSADEDIVETGELTKLVESLPNGAEPSPVENLPAAAVLQGVQDVSGKAPEATPQEEAAVVQEQSAQAAADTAQAPLSEEEQYVEDCRVNGTLEQKRILAAVETFCANIRPKAIITPANYIKQQYMFLEHLLWLLDHEYTKFRPAWNLLLVYFNLNHGNPTPASYTALSEYSAHRYPNEWNRGEENFIAYGQLMVMLRLTRNPATRKHDLKRLSLDKLEKSVFTEHRLSNLRQFYGQ